jgi:hypothetical protein
MQSTLISRLLRTCVYEADYEASAARKARALDKVFDAAATVQGAERQ